MFGDSIGQYCWIRSWKQRQETDSVVWWLVLMSLRDGSPGAETDRRYVYVSTRGRKRLRSTWTTLHIQLSRPAAGRPGGNRDALFRTSLRGHRWLRIASQSHPIRIPVAPHRYRLGEPRAGYYGRVPYLNTQPA